MDNKDIMRQEILITLKANNVYISGDLYFSLVFMNEDGLKKICHELNIKVG